MIVRGKITGRVGQIPDNMWDPNLYEQVNTQSMTQPMTQQPQQQGRSLPQAVGSIITGLLSPFLRGAERNVNALDIGVLKPLASRTGQKVSQQALEAMSSGDLERSKQLQLQAQELLNSGISSGDQQNRVQELREPLQFGKDVAAIGSWVAPGALGLAKVPARLVGGTLGGAGYTKETSPEGILGSAALGGGTSVALGAVLDKLFPAKATVKTIAPEEKGGLGRGLVKSNINPKTQVGPKMYSKGEKIVDYANEFNLKGTPTQQLKQINNWYDKLEDLKNNVANESTGKVPYNKAVEYISKDMLENGASYVGDATDDKLINLFFKRLSKYVDADGNLSVRALDEFKSTLPTGGFTRLAKMVDMSPKQALAVDYWHGTDKLLTELDPQVKALSLDQSKLYALAPGIAEQSEKSIKPLGLNIKWPVQQGIWAGGEVGRKLQGTSNLFGKAKEAFGPTVGAISGAVSGKVPALLPALMMGRGQPQGQQPTGMGSSEGMGMGETSQSPLDMLGITAQDAQLIAMLPSKTQESIVTELIKSKVTGGGGNVQLISDAATRAYQMLSTGEISTGMVGGRAQKAFGQLGVGGDQETLDFNVAVDNIYSAIAKVRGGTALTKEEKKLLRSYLPQTGDSKQILETKLRYIIQHPEVVVLKS